jgi:hypothetical protein
MRFPNSPHAQGWREQMPAHRPLPDMPLVTRDADAVSPSLHSRHLHLAALVVALATLGASAGLNVVDDPRPLDVQLSAAMHKAGDALGRLHGQLSRGLQVSLRAVADGRELPAATETAIMATAVPQAEAAADDRDQPVSAEPASPPLR